MRIAFFHNLPTGGHKRAAFEQAKGLSARGHNLHEYTLSTTDNKIWDISQVVEKSYVYDYDNSKLKTQNSKLRKLEERVAKDIDSRAYDVNLAQPCLIEQTPSILEFLKTPTVYYCPEPQRILFESYLREKLLKISEVKKPLWQPKKLWDFRIWQKAQAEAKRSRCASLILTNSYYSREVLYRTYGVLAQVNYLGVDAGVFRPQPEIKKENAILHIGTNFIKQPEFSLEVVSQIPEKTQPILWFRSQPDEKTKKRLEHLAKEKRVVIKFLDEADDEGLVKIYNQVKLTVCPSLMEPFGLVALESMACGTPVVAVKEGGYRESVVDEQTGFLVDRNEEKFAQTIANLLGNQDLHKTLPQNAREHIMKNWSWEKSVGELEDYLVELQK